jgi:hypothetical protein
VGALAAGRRLEEAARVIAFLASTRYDGGGRLSGGFVMRKAWLIAAAACVIGAVVIAWAPAPFRRDKAKSEVDRVVRAMEGYRTSIPPAQGLGEENGFTSKELEPYTMNHLAGVGRRLNVITRAECLALLPYVKDRDFKLRFIAQQAINDATKAYPHGMSIECVLDADSDRHREMVRRFEELIARLPS